MIIPHFRGGSCSPEFRKKMEREQLIVTAVIAVVVIGIIAFAILMPK